MVARLLAAAVLLAPLAWQACGGTTSSGGGGTASYATCDGPGQCVAKVPGCCGVCGAPTLADVVGVNASSLDEFHAATCTDANPVCPKCAEMIEPNLVAFCEVKRCTAIDVRTDAASACQTDDDCVLRGPTCCESCVPQPTELIAIAKMEAAAYQAQICAKEQACPACVPTYPAGWAAACATNGHCHVVQKTNVCPADQPSDGATCSVDASLVCEYGNDVRPGCRTHVTCPNGAWQVAVSGCPPLPVAGQGGCPASSPAAGTTCSNDGLVCDMGSDTLCACSSCSGGPCSVTPLWTCAAPPTTPGCAPHAPELGSACSTPDLTCIYGPSCIAPVAAGRRCKDGAWTNEPLACPV